MDRIALLAALMAAGFGLTHAAVARTINLSTGLDSSGAVIATGNTADANWTATSIFPESAPTAFTVFPDDGDWYAGWDANGPNSDWISSSADNAFPGAGGPPLETTYTRTFTLAGYEVATASLLGGWECDERCTLSLNGILLDGNGNFPGLAPISAPAADFVAGTNTLVAFGGDGFLDAMRLEATVSTPEPASLAVLAAGIGGAALVLRRRRPT